MTLILQNWSSNTDKISHSGGLKVSKKQYEKNYFLFVFIAFFKLISFPFL